MTEPKVRIAVLEEAQPVLDFLQEHHHDIGSVSADRLSSDAPADLRFLCVALVDHDALADLSYRMKQAWRARPELVSLTNTVVVMPTPLDTLLVVFVGIPAIEA